MWEKRIETAHNRNNRSHKFSSVIAWRGKRLGTAIETRKGKRFGLHRVVVLCRGVNSSQPSLSLSRSTENNEKKFRLENEGKNNFFESNKILRLFYVFFPVAGAAFLYTICCFSSLFHRLTFLFDCMHGRRLLSCLRSKRVDCELLLLVCNCEKGIYKN